MTEPSTDTHDYGLAQVWFDAVVDLPPADREAELTRLAAAVTSGDSVADLVRELVGRDEQPEYIGSRTSIGTAMRGDPLGVVDAPMGKYRVVRYHAGGGMGEVYEGRRDEPSERVAIKFLTSSRVREAKIADRYRREVQSLADNQHPGLVRYRDSLEFRGFPTIIMDWVDGEPLNAQHALVAKSVEATLELVAQVADAVHQLHDGGVIHRDLKPSNILVRTSDQRPVVIDFGLAQWLAEDAQGSLLSQSFSRAGTLGYMSPEQLRGRRLNARSDQYSLGALLFELITGWLPSPPDTETGEWPPQVTSATQDVDSAQQPAFDAEVAKQRQLSVSRDVSAVVAKAMEFRPEHRYESVARLASDLRAAARGDQVSARPLGRTEKARRLVRRHPVLAAFLIVSLLAWVAASISTVSSLRREREVSRQLQQKLGENDGLHDLLNDQFVMRASLERDGPETSLHDTLRRTVSELIERDDLLSRQFALGIGAQLIGLELRLRSSGAVHPLVERLEAIVDSVPPNHPSRCRFEMVAAGHAFRRGERDDALERFASIWPRLAADSPFWARHPDQLRDARFQVASRIGQIHEYQDRFEEARTWLSRAHRLARTESARVGVESALALLKSREGDLPGAVQDFEELAAQIETAEGDVRKFIPMVQGNLAAFLVRMAQPKRALKHTDSAIEWYRRKKVAPSHPHHLRALDHRAQALDALGRRSEAVDAWSTCHAAQVEAHGLSSPLAASYAQAAAEAALAAMRFDDMAKYTQAMVDALRARGDVDPAELRRTEQRAEFVRVMGQRLQKAEK